MRNLIEFFEIPAADFRRAVKFYETLFGIKLAVMECETEKMAAFPDENGKCPGAISWAADFLPSPQGVMLSLHVGDLDKALLAVVDNGGEIIRRKTKIEVPNRGYFAIICDSEGNSIGLHSDK